MKLYLAVCKSPTDGSYFISNHFYSTYEEAHAFLGDCLAGLFTSGPSIEVADKAPEIKPKEAVKNQPMPVEVQEEFSEFSETRITHCP